MDHRNSLFIDLYSPDFWDPVSIVGSMRDSPKETGQSVGDKKYTTTNVLVWLIGCMNKEPTSTLGDVSCAEHTKESNLLETYN